MLTYTGAAKFIKQILTDVKEQIDNNTIIGNFNTPLTSVDRSEKKISKAKVVLNYKLD